MNESTGIKPDQIENGRQSLQEGEQLSKSWQGKHFRPIVTANQHSPR